MKFGTQVAEKPPKTEEEVVHEPSSYQKRIYEFNLQASQDSIVNAVAGSGKSTTIRNCAFDLPKSLLSRTAFAAFNAHIVEELKKTLPKGLTVKTIHSFGFAPLKSYYRPICGDLDWIDGFKYHKLARQFWRQRGVNTYKNPDFEESTATAVRFVMLTRTSQDDAEAFAKMCSSYGVTLPTYQGTGTPISMDSLRESVVTVMEWGLDGTPDGSFGGAKAKISFDEMLHLPLMLGLSLPQFDRLYVDEAQDLSAAQRELAFRMRAPGGRQMFVGDPYQAIYAFAGADANSFRAIGEETGAADLPLSICYRCPEEHIKMAQEIVPHIEARPGAPAGVIEYIAREKIYSTVQEGDLILCRLTAPLIDLAFSLIRQGWPAMVRGRDIGQGLVRIVESVSRIEGFSFEELLRFLDDYAGRSVRALACKEDSEMAIESLLDRIKTVETIYLRGYAEGVRSLDAFKAYINSLFGEGRSVITLSTVHKAKGLENDRVFILNPDLMPFPKARRPQDVQQEMNLKYVALTRAKKALFFVEG